MLAPVNYIHLLNWYWDEVPYLTGYKSEYGTLFLAIVDTVNRNEWRKSRAEYDRLINKCVIGKRMYYEALKWLQAQQLISYEPGRNEYAAAQFDLTDYLKAEVQKRTPTGTSTAHQPETAPEAEVQKGDATTPQLAPLLHHSSTAASTSTAPIIDKPLNSKTEKPLNNQTSLSTQENERADFSDADAPVDQREESAGREYSYHGTTIPEQESTSTAEVQNNPAPGAATNDLVVHTDPPSGRHKPARPPKAEADYSIGYRIRQFLEAQTPGIPWGGKEGAAANQVADKIRNSLRQTSHTHADEDILSFLAVLIEKTYTLTQFFHYTDITQLNAKYGQIYQQLVDRKKSGNQPANASGSSARPIRQTDAEFAADIDRYAQMRYGGAGHQPT